MIVTLQQALQFLGIPTTATAEQQDLVTILIEMVQSEIEAEGVALTPRVVEDEVLNFTTTVDYSYLPKIEISKWRIFTRLEYAPVSGLVLVADNETLESDEYYVDLNSGLLGLSYSYAMVEASYTAGIDPNNIPSDLKFVALKGIREHFSLSGVVSQGTGNIKNKSLDRFSVTYANPGGSSSKPAYILSSAAVLNKYRQWKVWG